VAATIAAEGESGMWKFTIATCTLFLQNHEVEAQAITVNKNL